MKRLKMANLPYPEGVKPFPIGPEGDPPYWLNIDVISIYDQLKLATIELEYQLNMVQANKARYERKLEVYNAMLEAQAGQAK
jgi:hypothetical protein